jgi:hypothetical protein
MVANYEKHKTKAMRDEFIKMILRKLPDKSVFPLKIGGGIPQLDLYTWREYSSCSVFGPQSKGSVMMSVFSIQESEGQYIFRQPFL